MAEKKQAKAEKKTITREFNVPLRRAFEKPRAQRAKKALRVLREFMKKNFRVSEENISISSSVNNLLWARGLEKIPRRITVKAIFDEKTVKVLLPKEKIEEKKKETKKPVKEEKTEEEKAREKEIEKQKQEKKEMEKEAEAVAIKRGTK